MIKVTVLMGGVSSEREVSISSGKAVSKALKIAGYDIDEIVITNESFNAKIINSDITFIALHGRFGEDGKIQKILEDNNIIFTGSSSSSCRLSFNKFISRELLSKNNIKIPLGEK
ncbi:MAG: D-alanine--D-alanine ligase, partial [Verrucomicrobiota bacterium]|nr:D-alanine--D-alanine ligase [Verrucomicrobiota bacterium]